MYQNLFCRDLPCGSESSFACSFYDNGDDIACIHESETETEYEVSQKRDQPKFIC